AVAEPIAHPCPTSIGINSIGHYRDVVGLFSRAAVGIPVWSRLKSKTAHKDASFLEGAPTAAPNAIPKPIGPTVPTGIGINSIGRYRDVVGLFSGAAIRSPGVGRLEPQPTHVCARFLKRPPIHSRDVLPHLGRNRVGKSVKGHVHADRNLAIDFDDLP